MTDRRVISRASFSYPSNLIHLHAPFHNIQSTPIGTIMNSESTIENSDQSLLRQLSSAIDSIPMNRAHIMIIVMIGLGTLFNAIEQYNAAYAGPFLADYWSLDPTDVALLTTYTFAGVTIGSIVAGLCGDFFGRRTTYMYNLIVFSVGGLISAFSPDFGFLLIARLIVGIGLGGEISVALTMMSELMPTRKRGLAVGTINVMGGGFGIFVASALAALMLGPLSRLLGGDDVAWRYLLGILIVPALFLYYFRRYIPESPRYLVRRGKIAQANVVLSQLATGSLRKHANLTVHEYVRGEEGRVFERERTRIREMFQTTLLRRGLVLWTMEIIAFGVQVAVTSLMPVILVSKGFSNESSLNFALLINVGSLLGAVAAAVVGQYVPRRLTLCAVGVLAAASALGFGFLTDAAAVVIFGLLTAFTFMMLNTTIWIYLPELYPTRLRAIGTGFGNTVESISATFFPLVVASFLVSSGSTGVFIFVAVLYIALAVVALFGPETKGLTLEEISERYDEQAAAVTVQGEK